MAIESRIHGKMYRTQEDIDNDISSLMAEENASNELRDDQLSKKMMS